MKLPSPKHKVDRRILRTKQSLKDALYQLLQNKEYSEITVEEITDRANIGRATFYLHYKDKEDLLLEEFSSMVDDLIDLLNNLPNLGRLIQIDNMEQLRNVLEERGIYGPVRKIFEHIYENQDYYSLLIKNSESGQIYQRIQKISTRGVEIFLDKFHQSGNLSLPENIPLSIIPTYFSGAMLSTIIWWVKAGYSPSPQEMTKIFYQMFVNGSGISITLNNLPQK